jgi:hypothetical protein
MMTCLLNCEATEEDTICVFVKETPPCLGSNSGTMVLTESPSNLGDSYLPPNIRTSWWWGVTVHTEWGVLGHYLNAQMEVCTVPDGPGA